MTEWLSNKEMSAWRAYIRTVNDLAAALERDLVAQCLTLGDYQVLVFLSEADNDSMRMCDLADRLQLSPSGLTRRLDGLVKAKFVTRKPSTDDGRVMMGVLTSSGRSALTNAAPHHVDSVRRHIFDHLTPEQVTAMDEIFTAIEAGLESDEPKSSPDIA